MKQGYIIQNQDALHFMTFTVVDWVDVFSSKVYRDIAIDSMKFCQANKGMQLYAYVIMSNHIHLICRSETGRLSDLVRDYKKFVATNILKEINNGTESRADWMLKRFEFAARSNQRNSIYQFWQVNNHPEEIFSEPFLWSKINYIHMNPVRAGIVNKASDYTYNSASNYVDRESIVEVYQPSTPIIDPLKKSGYNFDISLW